MIDKNSWMEGYKAGMKRLAYLVSNELGGPKPPSIWDADDQRLADQDWAKRT